MWSVGFDVPTRTIYCQLRIREFSHRGIKESRFQYNLGPNHWHDFCLIKFRIKHFGLYSIPK